MINADNARRAGLDKRYLQFWPSSRGLSIGLPNPDGTYNVLIVGTLPGSFLLPPFGNETATRNFLIKHNQHLLHVQPDLPAQLVGRLRGGFYTSAIDKWTYGRRVALCGDAGRSSPGVAGHRRVLGDGRRGWADLLDQNRK